MIIVFAVSTKLEVSQCGYFASRVTLEKSLLNFNFFTYKTCPIYLLGVVVDVNINYHSLIY